MLPALELIQLTRRYGNFAAVDRLDLRVEQGEFYALLGPNGAGKTTTLRMVAGLLKPDSGEIRVLGRDAVHDGRAARQLLAYLPDDPLLYGKLRPLEYLEFVAGLWGVDPATAAADARDLLERLDLWSVRGEYTENFSRGMRQKLALAGAFVHRPQLIILDEPLTGLDAGAARLVKDMLGEYVRRGNTVILTTHILEIAERLAGRIGILDRGRLLAEGTLDELRRASGEAGGTLEAVFLELLRSGAAEPAEPGR
jgi:ABC-2 type transport system ATP-binding protein